MWVAAQSLLMEHNINGMFCTCSECGQASGCKCVGFLRAVREGCKGQTTLSDVVSGALHISAFQVGKCYLGCRHLY